MDPHYSFTNTELLAALRRDDASVAWAEVERRLKPVAFAVAQRILHNVTDAQDAVQDALLSMWQECRAGHYDRSRGRFHVWARSIVCHRALDLFRKRARNACESALPEDDPAVSELEQFFDAQYEAMVFRRTFELLQTRSDIEPDTIRMYVRYTVDGKTSSEVAAEFATSTQAVYNAKHRCQTFMRKIEPEVRRSWELD